MSDADAVLIAVPGAAIADVFDNVAGWQGKTVIDATNLIGIDPPAGFSSNAEFVKSKTNGPTAKAFNVNFARLFDRLDDVKTRPSNLWSGDEEAREVVEQLIHDAGYDPIYAGALDKAAMQEGVTAAVLTISQASGPFFYRVAPPDDF